MTISKAVQSGVKFLDENVTNWRNRINVSELDMVDSRRCILAQVYGEFAIGASWIPGGSSIENIIAHGFDTDGSYSELKAEWVSNLGIPTK